MLTKISNYYYLEVVTKVATLYKFVSDSRHKADHNF